MSLFSLLMALGLLYMIWEEWAQKESDDDDDDDDGGLEDKILSWV